MINKIFGGKTFYLTQKFGENPDFYRPLGIKAHNGLDYACPVGTRIFACIDGVVHLGEDKIYGKHIKIKNKNYEAIFAHLSDYSIKTGTVVRVGDLIGLSGNTGNSTGPHLHFGILRVGDEIISEKNGYFGYVDPFIIDDEIEEIEYQKRVVEWARNLGLIKNTDVSRTPTMLEVLIVLNRYEKTRSGK